MKTEIKGMPCPYDAFGMEKELRQVTVVDKVEIELKKGLAYISTPISQKPTKESLEKIISFNLKFTTLKPATDQSQTDSAHK